MAALSPGGGGSNSVEFEDRYYNEAERRKLTKDQKKKLFEIREEA